MSDQIRVFLVDDHQFILSMVKPYLEVKGIQVIGTANSYEDAIEHVFNDKPDVFIIDLNLAGKSGIDLIKVLRDRCEDCKFLIFSQRTALPAIGASYRAGAHGYLTKNGDPSELIVAINKISEGEIYYMPGLAEKILNFQFASNDPDPRIQLSKKEFELFMLLSQGVTLEKISQQMEIVPRSVTARIFDIRKKLNGTNEDFAIIANRHGITFLRD
jgi:two-component system invasion response regulator UvrY